MPILEQQDSVLGSLSVDTVITTSMDASVRLGGSSSPSTTITATCSPTLRVGGTLSVATTIVTYTRASVPPVPDISVSLTVATTVTASVTPQLVISAQANVDTSIEAEVIDSLSRAEVFREVFTIDRLLPKPTGGRAYSEILTVDGNVLEVKDWSFKKQKESIRHELAITLADPEDGALISRNSQITFQAGYANYPYTSFTYKTLLSTGYANESTYEIRPPSQGEDSFTFIGLTSTQSKLNRTPATNLVLYDPTLVDVDEADFRTIYDEYGRAFQTEIVPISKMTLADIFEEIFVNRCEFASYETNLPEDTWRISRIDFNAGEAYLAPISGRIGMYNPALEEINNTLWIRGTGIPYPAGQPAPEQILASDSCAPRIITNHRRIDVIEMVYNLWTYEYDYTDIREEEATYDTDNDGEVVRTTITRYFQEYYRDSQPSRPVHEEPLYTDVEDRILGSGWILEQARENFYYKGTNRIARRKTVRVPVPTSFAPYEPTLQLAATEREDYYWKGHPFQPSKIYQFRRSLKVSGLVASDSANARADGTPFREALIDSHRKANFNENTSIESGPISSEEEVTNIINKDSVETWISQRDHCAGLTKRSWVEQKVGDIGKSALINDQRQMYIFDAENAERTFDFKETVNIGELNPLEGKKLCKQILQRRKLFPKSVSDRLFELDLNLMTGSTRKLIDRDGNSLGIYEISSVSLSGGVDGYFTDYEGEQSA